MPTKQNKRDLDRTQPTVDQENLEEEMPEETAVQEQETQEQIIASEEIDIASLPFDAEIPEGSKALTIPTPHGVMLAEGLFLSPDASFTEVIRVTQMVTSYTGVKPLPVGDYAQRWLRCIGFVYAPFEAEIPVVDRETGIVTMKPKRWKSPLFKVIDPETHKTVILTGGGKTAKEFANTMVRTGNVGDFPDRYYDAEKDEWLPMPGVEICFNVEQRTGIKETWRGPGDVVAEKQPRILYRLAVRFV